MRFIPAVSRVRIPLSLLKIRESIWVLLFLFVDTEFVHETLRSSGEGARRPGDVCLVRTEAERRPNPPLATNKKESNRISFLLVLKDNFETEIPRSSTYGAKRLGDKP